MGEQRQRYNDEFKQQTVKFIQEQTKSMGEISEELNIPAEYPSSMAREISTV